MAAAKELTKYKVLANATETSIIYNYGPNVVNKTLTIRRYLTLTYLVLPVVTQGKGGYIPTRPYYRLTLCL